MKRLFDILVSGIGLFFLTPVLALTALAVRLSSRGPVLFRQERLGRGMKPFRIYKFRTMVVGAERLGPGVTSAADGRVTRVGRFLRHAKLDELPQLLNVLKGDMSLVGPRPELPHFVRLYEEDFREVLRVRPGITDIASITYRDESDQLGREADPEGHYVKRILPDKLRLSKRYVERASLPYDLKLLFQTVLLLIYPSRAIERGLGRLGRHHEALSMAIQGVLAIVANVAAFWLLYEGAPPAEVRDVAARALPALLLIRMIWFWTFRLDRDIWQYVGLRELHNIVLAVALGTATFGVLVLAPDFLPGYPVKVLLLDGLVCLALLVGVRVTRRLHREIRHQARATRRVLLVGAGDSAERVLRDLQGPGRPDVQVVGLVGEDPSTVGLLIHSVPILGSCADLEDIVRDQAPDEVVVVASDVSALALEDTLRRCRGSRGPVRVIPDHDGIPTRRDQQPRLEEPDPDELLFRDPVKVDWDHVCDSYRGRRVLVTGGGGSIGSEICRQIASCAPERLVIFEKHEESLYHIDRELRGRYPRAGARSHFGRHPRRRARGRDAGRLAARDRVPRRGLQARAHARAQSVGGSQDQRPGHQDLRRGGGRGRGRGLRPHLHRQGGRAGERARRVQAHRRAHGRRARPPLHRDPLHGRALRQRARVAAAAWCRCSRSRSGAVVRSRSRTPTPRAGS